MDGVSWALLVKPVAAVVIIGGMFALGRFLHRLEPRVPAGRLKRLLFFKIGDGDITDPPGEPGARARERR